MLALASACGGTTDCCVDGSSDAVVEGYVLNASYAAFPGVDVRSDGFRHPCDAPEQLLGPAEGVTRTDSTGWFSLRVVSFLGAPGSSCVRLVLSAGSAPPDTTDGIEVRFFEGEPGDTARVILRLTTAPLPTFPPAPASPSPAR